MIDLADVTLVAGTNLLAVHGINRSAGNSDFLFDCELEAQLTPTGGATELVYMTTPTPGSENAGGLTDLGPAVRDVTQNPPRPDTASQDEILITADVTQTRDAIAEVRLFHRQGFAAEVELPMSDDGLVPDLVTFRRGVESAFWELSAAAGRLAVRGESEPRRLASGGVGLAAGGRGLLPLADRQGTGGGTADPVA